MPALSLTGIGAIVTIVMTVLKMFGIELPDGSDKQIADAILTLIGIVMLVVGQLRRKDLVAGIVRK